MHTPEPWGYADGLVTSINRHVVARVYPIVNLTASVGSQRANGKLIAAAPVLAAELRSAVDYLERLGYCEGSAQNTRNFERMKRVLAQATE